MEDCIKKEYSIAFKANFDSAYGQNVDGDFYNLGKDKKRLETRLMMDYLTSKASIARLGLITCVHVKNSAEHRKLDE